MGSHPKPKRLAQEEMNAMEKLQTASLSQAGLSTKNCSYFKRPSSKFNLHRQEY